MPITEAAELGRRSFEHLFGIWASTSDVEPELRRQAARIDIAEGGYNSWFHQSPASIARRHSWWYVRPHISRTVVTPLATYSSGWASGRSSVWT